MAYYSAAGNSYSIATGDFNGDGIPDLAPSAYGSSTGLWVLPGRSNAPFGPALSYMLGAGCLAITAGDFNKDNLTDLACSSWDTGNVDVFLSTTKGSFSFKASSYSTGGSYPNGIAAADFNQDGWLDIASSNWYSNDVSIFFGMQNGTFNAAVRYPFSFSPKGAFLVADINGDGINDILASEELGVNLPPAHSVVLLGRGDGTFQSPLATNLYGYGAAAKGDLNGDGKLDLVGYNANNVVAILLGNGDGTFRSYRNYTIDQGGSTQVADFTLDGYLDISIAGGNGVLVLPGKGDGTFGQGTTYPASAPSSLVVGDFDQNGAPDLATSSLYGTVSVLTRNLSPSTTRTTSPTTPASSPSASTASHAWKDIVIGVVAGVGGAVVIGGVVGLIRKFTRSRIYAAPLAAVTQAVYDMVLTEEDYPPAYSEVEIGGAQSLDSKM